MNFIQRKCLLMSKEHVWEEVNVLIHITTWKLKKKIKPMKCGLSSSQMSQDLVLVKVKKYFESRIVLLITQLRKHQKCNFFCSTRTKLKQKFFCKKIFADVEGTTNILLKKKSIYRRMELMLKKSKFCMYYMYNI